MSDPDIRVAEDKPAVALRGKAIWINHTLLGLIASLLILATWNTAGFKASVDSGNEKLAGVADGLKEVRIELTAFTKEVSKELAEFSKTMTHIAGTNGALEGRLKAVEAELIRMADEDRKQWEAIRVIPK